MVVGARCRNVCVSEPTLNLGDIRLVGEFCVHTLRRLSPLATWAGAGIGRDQMTVAQWLLGLGGHCLSGMKDNVRLDRDTLAPSKAALVQAVANLCQRPGRPVTSVCGARVILGLEVQPPMPSQSLALSACAT